MVVVWIVIALVVVIGAFLAFTYNGLVSKRNRIENAWSQIDVQLKRRLDLIPNLVETVKGYAAHEKETLDAVIKARNAAMTAAGPAAAAAADNQVSGALRQLFALSEAYPDLKANQNFLQLQEELTATEAALLEQHRDPLCGPEVSTGPVSFDWHCGFWRALHVGGPAGSFQDSDEELFFAVEVMVDHILVDAGDADDLVNARSVDALH